MTNDRPIAKAAPGRQHSMQKKQAFQAAKAKAQEPGSASGHPPGQTMTVINVNAKLWR